MAKKTKSKPIHPGLLYTLKQTLSIKGKKSLNDWAYLIVGIGGGLHTEDHDNTITIQELYEILTFGLTQTEKQGILSTVQNTKKKARKK